jgi:hypothetical protein
MRNLSIIFVRRIFGYQGFHFTKKLTEFRIFLQHSNAVTQFFSNCKNSFLPAELGHGAQPVAYFTKNLQKNKKTGGYNLIYGNC